MGWADLRPLVVGEPPEITLELRLGGPDAAGCQADHCAMNIRPFIVSRKLVAILVAAGVLLGAGFYAGRIYRGYRQDQRLLRSVVNGVELYVSWVDPLTGHVSGLELVSTPNAPVTDNTLSRVAELRGLRQLLIMGSAITDDGVKLLEPLRRLWQLDVGGTAIGDDGVAAIRNFLSWKCCPRLARRRQIARSIRSSR